MTTPINPSAEQSKTVSASTFEEMLQAHVSTVTGGRDWRSVSLTPQMSTHVLRTALNNTALLPAWRLVVSLLQQLGLPQASYPDFQQAYERAKLYRPWSDTVRISRDDDIPGTYVINNSGGSVVHVHSERQFSRRSAHVAEPVIQDASGYTLKPDPMRATTLAELEVQFRAYWEWAGKPSSRTVAERSRGAFSHATAAKFIYDRPGKPELKMKYLLGLIRGCGGDETEQQRWITAWRLTQVTPERRLHLMRRAG